MKWTPDVHLYYAKVLRWDSGKVVRLKVDLGFHTYRNILFHLDKVAVSKAVRMVVQDCAERIAPRGTKVLVRTRKGLEFGKWFADIYYRTRQSDGGPFVWESLNEYLVREGPAEPEEE